MELKGKVAVIVGTSSGIGRATAIAFARKGARVVLAARRKDRLYQLSKQLPSSVAVPTDVRDENQLNRLFDEAVRKFGRVDILINSAGVGLKAPLENITKERWEETFQTNAMGTFLCAREAARVMRKQKSGHIITVSSLAGLVSVPGLSGYCASKHAASSFLRAVRWELRKGGIRVSIIHPYKVATEFFDDYATRPDLRRMLSAEDIARYLVALAERNPFKMLFFACLNFVKRMAGLLGLRG